MKSSKSIESREKCVTLSTISFHIGGTFIDTIRSMREGGERERRRRDLILIDADHLP